VLTNQISDVLTEFARVTMAEEGHGVAIIPSALRTHRYTLRIVGIAYRGKRLREPLTIFWDKRRPLPHYATVFCEMLAAYMRQVFPITRPSELKTDAIVSRPVVTRNRKDRPGR
jgi:DNA-binding transcriptional LysR family regulator